VEGEVDHAGTAVSAVPAGQGTETILVVEDDLSLRNFVARSLKLGGYTVLSAGMGEEALVCSKTHTDPVHLLLTDVVMPGMSGREVARLIQEARPGIRVLYMSGCADNSIVHHGVLDDGTALLEKPFTVDVLLRKVREALDGR
jgi:DNA-binding response OmpR family regulator